MEQYEKPELEQLGQLHEVTGGLFDSILEDLFGGGRGPGHGPGRPPRGSR